jgi:microcystin-dependent protein
MSTPFLGEIKMFGGNFAPKGYALCNGQLLAINQNTALFALVGTFYGGNGTTNFALPDLQSRVPLHMGQGPGLSSYDIGQSGGVENVTLATTEIPSHSHNLNELAASANSKTPVGAMVPANVSGTNTNIYSSAATDSTMRAGIIGSGGGSQPHNNIQPYLVLNFIIALEGIFPSRN